MLRIQENQFHILEALNTIEYKMGITPVLDVMKDHQMGLEARLQEEIGSLR
jgi:hypothetical protein